MLLNRHGAAFLWYVPLNFPGILPRHITVDTDHNRPGHDWLWAQGNCPLVGRGGGGNKLIGAPRASLQFENYR